MCKDVFIIKHKIIIRSEPTDISRKSEELSVSVESAEMFNDIMRRSEKMC